MTIRNLEFAFRARSVAFIGATPREGSVGQKVIRNLRNGGFHGAIWPVNPHHEQIYGLPCFPSVTTLPETPDLGVIATPAETVPGLIAQLAAKGTRAAVVITAGLSRDGGLRQAMLDAARPHNLRIIGPNSLGLFVPAIGLNASFAHISPAAGGLAFLSQSGALASAVLDWTADRRIGFSTIVSLGDMADVDVADLLDMLAGDRATNAVLLYLETVINTRKFMSAARAAARMKPVIVIKSGRSAAAARAAATHTGALAGADEVVNAAFRRAGLLRVRDLDQLFQAAETLARFRPIERGRLGIVTNGGGAGVLAVDRLVDFGGELSELSERTIAALDAVLPATWSRANPVDIIGDAGPERYRRAIEAVFADANVDALLVMACPTALASAERSAEAVIETVKEIDAAKPRRFKPILTSWLGEHDAGPARARLRSAGLATYDTPADAIQSLTYLTGYSAAQRALLQTPPALPADFAVDVAPARALFAKVAAEGRDTLTEPEAKTALACFGIPVVETLVAAKIEDVAAVAGRLLAKSPAIALKLLSRDVTHKSDVGGVVLGLRSVAAATQAASDIAERLAARAPQARIDGFTVQTMVARPKNAHELIVGIGDDSAFGPTIVFGAGGTAVEVVADTAIGLPPLDMKLAHDLIGQTRISRLLGGYRDRAPADVDAVALTLVRVSQMVIDCPEIAGLDINPLLADAAGVVALDARIVIDPKRIGARTPNARLSIRPYPSAWERPVTTASGREVILRPIRPEDARLYPDFVARLENRDIRLRLLAPRKRFADDFLARLTQIDYAREMAFVAIDPESGMLVGVARLVADPDYTCAEYAVIVRSDLKAQGIGWRLMEHLIAYARAEGLGRLEGTVLAENVEMLEMCRELGFSVARDPEDPGACQVRIELAPATTASIPAQTQASSVRPR